MIGIVNYNMGNLQSVKNSLDYLNIANKFKISTQVDTLMLGGIIEKTDPLFAYLQQQFKHLFLLEVDASQNGLDKLQSYPLHYFSPFFNLQA